MKRDLDRLRQQQFDLLVIGAGVHGACVARDASLRGLKVALIDKGDLCGATSFNSLKTIHGGIRYLQHLNFARTLSSIKEQTAWLRTAPQRVKPLPFLMPTYGHGMRGPLAMFAGISLYGLLGLGRNRGLPEVAKIRHGKVVSKAECLKIAKGLPTEGLSGGAIWNDAQVEDADQTVLEICADAERNGATIANYVASTNLCIEGETVVGSEVKDQLSGEAFRINARSVVNTSGPWIAEQLARPNIPLQEQISVPLVKSMNLVVNREFGQHAVSFYSQRDSDSKLGNTKRLYFMVPWKGCTMFGTTHEPFKGSADELTVTTAEIDQFIQEIDQAYPALELTHKDVLFCYYGLTPAEPNSEPDGVQGSENALRLHESKVLEHSAVNGLFSVVSIKWTTARLVAEQCVDKVASWLTIKEPCQTSHREIPEIGLSRRIAEMEPAQLQQWCADHVETTMVQSLSDLLLRRSDDFVLGNLSTQRVSEIASILGALLNWDTAKISVELEQLKLYQRS